MSRFIAAALLVAAAVLGWWWLFPSEESRIRQRLDALVDDTNEAGGDVAGLASAARVSTYFTEDVTIEPPGGAQPLQGRQIILSIASRLKTATGTTTAAVRDVDVSVAPEKTSATVNLTAVVTRNEGTPDATVDAHSFALTLRKVNDTWLIAHVRSVETER